jgi:hypothetical protein
LCDFSERVLDRPIEFIEIEVRTAAAPMLLAAFPNICGESADRKIIGGTDGWLFRNPLTTLTPFISGSLRSSRISPGRQFGVLSAGCAAKTLSAPRNVPTQRAS